MADCMSLSCHVYTCFRVNSHSKTWVSKNVKELFAWNRHDIWCLGDCNGTQTHNHWVCKWTLNHLAKLTKWLSCFVSSYLNGCGFKSCCSHLNFRYCTCFGQRVPWDSGNYRGWIHSETCTWHGKNIKSNALHK